MKNAVRIAVSDPLLKRAVGIILKNEGYALDGSDDDLTVTDSAQPVSYAKTLYILKEMPQDGRAYLLRPFGEDELISAVRELCKDAPQNDGGELKMDKRHTYAQLNGEKIPLSEKEAALLSLLMSSRGRAVSDEEIVQKVFFDGVVEDSNIAAVYISYLRKKLEGKAGRRLIVRERGQGYVLK